MKKLVDVVVLLIVIAICGFYLAKNPDHKFPFFIILAYCWLRFRKIPK